MNSSATLQLDFKRSRRKPVQLQPRAWRGFTVERVVLESDEAYGFRATGGTHYLALHDMRLRDGELHIDGLPRISQTDLRDTLTFAPRGCTIEGWASPRRGHNSYTAFYFDPEEVCEGLHERYARAGVRPFAYARSAALSSTMTKIRDIVSAPDTDSLYAEALCLAAAMEVLGIEAPAAFGRLTKAQVDLVSEYVDCHLHGLITLDELANVVGLSRSHFSRSFKAATGQGPYRFVTARRIARARAMLEAKDGLSVAAIAQAAGFGSVAAFRRAFQQSIGMAPQQYRRTPR